MRRAQPASIFSHGWMIGRRAFLTLAVLGLLAAPSRSPAQDAGGQRHSSGTGECARAERLRQ